MPTVLIIGPLPAQAAALQRRHPALRLRFLASDERASRIGALVRHADHVVMLASFISHAHQRAVVDAGAKPVLVHGGVSAVSRALAMLETIPDHSAQV